VARISELTGRLGVDVVFDAMGGPHVKRSYAALNRTGLLVCYGFTKAELESACA